MDVLGHTGATDSVIKVAKSSSRQVSITGFTGEQKRLSVAYGIESQYRNKFQ